MNKLIIDTSDNKLVTVGLKIGEKEFTLSKKVTFNGVQFALPMIDSLLNKYSISVKEIDLIDINVGPGSLTGIKVGMAIANALSYCLKIPINYNK